MPTTPATPRKLSPRAAKAAAEPISPALSTMSLAEAKVALMELDQQFGVIPARLRDGLDQTISKIGSGALPAQHASIAEMVTGMPTLLATLTDVENVTGFHPSDVAEQLHTSRNIVSALAVASADSIGAKTGPVLGKCTRLKTRTVQNHRALTDDEILLARVYAATLSARAPHSQAASIYAMTDTGMVPGETTSVTTRDVDDCEQPTLAYAPGNGHLSDRYLPLDKFGSAIIARRVLKAMSDGYAADRPLTYAPRKNQPGTAPATASAQGVLDRFLAELGLASIDTTASSITLWRVATVLATQGEDAALQVSGRTTKAQMYAQLNLPTVERPGPAEDEITTFGEAS